MNDEVERFRKKPVVLEAMRLGVDDAALVAWSGGAVTMYPEGERGPVATVATLEGGMYAGPGDWIIKGVAGEFYPCKPDIFDATYEIEAAIRKEQDPSMHHVEDSDFWCACPHPAAEHSVVCNACPDEQAERIKTLEAALREVKALNGQ